MYTIQVKIKTDNKWEWRDIHPTNGPAYVYTTKQEALSMLQMCYSNCVYNEEVRVHQSL